WIMIGIAICAVTQGVAFEYAILAVQRGLPGAVWATWLQTWVTAFIVPCGLLLLLLALFPTGRSLSPRWRVLTLASIAWTVIGVAETMVTRAPMVLTPGFPQPANPLGVLPATVTNGPVGGAFWVVGIGLLLVGVLEAVQRLRRSAGDERQQMKWFVYVGAVTTVAFIPFTMFSGDVADSAGNLIPMIGFGIALPAACGVAILRYRLYDIDVVIRRTIVFALLALFITAVYAVVVAGVGAVAGGGNALLSFAAAVVVAVAFQPVRDRARLLADRLVFGRRATPYEVLTGLSVQLARAGSTDEALPRIARVVGEATASKGARVWLRAGDSLVPSASWPANDGPAPPAVKLDGESLPELPATEAFPVTHSGTTLGAITLDEDPADPLTPTKAKLVLDVAGQAGLVLRNVQMVEDLRASRLRIVAAQDEERRRIQRALRGGAERRLTGLAASLADAEHRARSEGAPRTLPAVRDLRRNAQDALDNLRGLARGLYPPLLEERGLAAALEAQAGIAAAAVEVRADHLERYPVELEAALYFCALEAMQNASKYAEASHVLVRLESTNGDLRFEVTDDGRGFDAAETAYGTGLQGMADRLAAIGGALDVRSSPGRGTSVSGIVPVGARPGAAVRGTGP
ncbi:MAG TPA: ATP-binding protein, partial [Actinomycetota bacterium]|nr:ATP-binding protein [Actinomycetota bacterium]